MFERNSMSFFCFVGWLLCTNALGQDCSLWIQKTGPGPLARDEHAMTYDAKRGVTVLFGGWNNLNQAFSDTWTWNGATWNDVTSAGPNARYSHAMAFHGNSAAGDTILFGGIHLDLTAASDTWKWNGTAWTQLFPGTAPSARYAHNMAYDEGRGVTVLFGGATPSPSNETWEWNGTNWDHRFPSTSPPARVYHAMAYDRGRDVIVLFGGSGSTTFLGDTWEWNGINWTNPSNAGPSPRYWARLVYDETRLGCVLFGGNASSTFPTDTWLWNGNTWAEISNGTTPPGRTDHAMAYDRVRRTPVLFGGSTGGTPLPDTWEFGCIVPALSTVGLVILVALLIFTGSAIAKKRIAG